MPKQLVDGRLVNVAGPKMYRSVATTPHGTFVKARSAHVYTQVVVWHDPRVVMRGGVMRDTTGPTWHRAGSRLPTSYRGMQRLGVYPVVSTPI